jgi:hypothetical protein
MLTISPEARQYALEKGASLFLEYLTVNNCCIPFQAEPTVRYGMPHNPEHYQKENIDGVDVFIPVDLPDVHLSIKMTTFMGLKRLIVTGWRHA